MEAADLLGVNEDSRLLYLVAVGPVKGIAERKAQGRRE
jgi:hypothetical protein